MASKIRVKVKMSGDVAEASPVWVTGFLSAGWTPMAKPMRLKQYWLSSRSVQFSLLKR